MWWGDNVHLFTSLLQQNHQSRVKNNLDWNNTYLTATLMWTPTVSDINIWIKWFQKISPRLERIHYRIRTVRVIAKSYNGEMDYISKCMHNPNVLLKEKYSSIEIFLLRSRRQEARILRWKIKISEVFGLP